LNKGDGTYNAVVIGAGPGGLVVAAGLAGLGARVALIEKGRMGGDCLNTGCVPSKALIKSARVAHAFRTAGRFGLTPQEFRPDVGAVFRRMREARAVIEPHDSVERFESLGIDVFHGVAGRLISPTCVAVGDAQLKTRHVVLATGGRPLVPPIEGLDGVPFHTNETFFDQITGSPGSLCVVGAGPIGCELSQVMARLGVETTTVEAQEQVLGNEDEDAASMVSAALVADGVDLLLGHTVRRVRPGPAELGPGAVRVTLEDLAGKRTFERDYGALLLAVGRRPNVEKLGLEDVGVEIHRGGLQVDASLRTRRKNIHAVGDVVGPYQFTHFADAQARTVVRNILIPWWPARFDARVVPWATFTDPECARVGLSERQAGEQGVQYAVHRFELAGLDRAVCDSETDGFVKVLANAKGHILGATCVGAGAGDWVHEYVLAMKQRIPLPAISGTTHIYPTYAEACRRPADGFMRGKLTPMAKRLLARRWGKS
jgi:pyruvate/2-oxoglutarate dehydrogenase complex dihydrolipoamide dehydrogenase (E3) component